MCLLFIKLHIKFELSTLYRTGKNVNCGDGGWVGGGVESNFSFQL